MSLIITMFAALPVNGAAQFTNPSTYPDFFTQNVNECYFASVSNGENFGMGTSSTTVTVQNLSNEPGVVYLVTGGSGGFAEGQFAALQPGASKTFSAAELQVPRGTTAPVAVLGYNWASSQARKFTSKDGIAIGCVAKQAVAGINLPYTSAVDHAVSGYNATSGREVGFFNALYLPIVQTNCGPGGCWDTLIRLANVGPFDNAAVTVRFYPSDDGQGSLDTGFQLQKFLGQGESWSIRLSEHVPEGWVGSAHVYTDDSVVAIADRYKSGTNMWISNTASNAVAESKLQVPSGPTNMPYVLYAPDVRLDYNGWNTGISVANTVNEDNTVNIQYFGSDGNAPQAQTQRLAAHGMTYFYNPASPSEDSCAQPVNQIVTCDFVGGAIILSQQPVAVAVDGVKYFGNDANVGQAFSYSATGNVFQVQAAPLVQKGSQLTGMGATSGLTFLNPNADGTYVTANWINPSGISADNAGVSVVWIPGFATGFIYTMTQANVPNGFTGSAYVASQLPIAGTSANVDYAVDGDGTAIWNLYNPCGYYRSAGDCVYTPTPPPLATKTFDVRPLGTNAMICAFNATDGQGGKANPPQGDCVPQLIFDKGASDGGQGQPLMYGAPVLECPSRGSEPTSTCSQLNSIVEIAIDDTTNTITVLLDGEPITNWEMFNWVTSSGAPANINLTCSVDRSLAVDGYAINQTTPQQLTGAALRLLGDPTYAIIQFYRFEPTIGDWVAHCGQIERGIFRLQTAGEMQAQLGTVVAPITVDTAGKAALSLPASCYYFMVSAEGYTTHVSGRECLEAGQTLNNPVDLRVPVVGVGSLTKWFCTSVDNGACISPITDFTLVTVTDAVGDVSPLTPNADGSFTIDPLIYGTYWLAWEGSSVVADGSEPVDVDGDKVVYNDLVVLSTVSVCVADQNGVPANGTLEYFQDGELAGTTSITAGVATVRVYGSGAYTFTASAPRMTSASLDYDVTEGVTGGDCTEGTVAGENEIRLVVTAPPTYLDVCLRNAVRNLPIGGVTVTATIGGSTVGTGMTDFTGRLSIPIAFSYLSSGPVTINLTATASGYSNGTASATLAYLDPA